MVDRNDYRAIAASQTDAVVGNAGKQGDIIERLVITVTTAASAVVSLKDGAAGASIPIFPNNPGGGIGTYTVLLGAKATATANPGWRITTGAGSTVVAVGRFQ